VCPSPDAWVALGGCKEPGLISSALSFYRLTAAWMLSIVKGGSKELHLPLPVPCPMDFAMLPEFLVEDLVEFLLYISYQSRSTLSGENLTEIMEFLIVFVGSPLYIKNPYLRSKFVEVLCCWAPLKDFGNRDDLRVTKLKGLIWPWRGLVGERSVVGDAQRAPPPPTALVLYETHPLAVQHMVPSLLRLYVDIEFTGSHNQFYDKFNIRHTIGQLLEVTWKVPVHQKCWMDFSKSEPEFYLKFL
ncbi:hypothetical protein CYMTET_32824, partial [Cymbomonas tetramitiformis]